MKTARFTNRICHVSCPCMCVCLLIIVNIIRNMPLPVSQSKQTYLPPHAMD